MKKSNIDLSASADNIERMLDDADYDNRSRVNVLKD